MLLKSWAIPPQRIRRARSGTREHDGLVQRAERHDARPKALGRERREAQDHGDMDDAAQDEPRGDPKQHARHGHASRMMAGSVAADEPTPAKLAGS